MDGATRLPPYSPAAAARSLVRVPVGAASLGPPFRVGAWSAAIDGREAVVSAE